MANIRRAILKALKDQKRTRNWLAEETGIVPPAVYQYLNGKSDMGSKRIEKLMKALGLEIRPKE
jgi:predicted transcriptional regulator